MKVINPAEGKVVNTAEGLRVLVGCEMSGMVREAFAARGWEAVSADILPTERYPRLTYHSSGVVRTVLNHNVRVNSVHYQAINRLGAGLTAEALAPDGVVEAVSGQVNSAPVLAVQWHPEWRTDANPDSQAYFRLIGRLLRGEPAALPRSTP